MNAPAAEAAPCPAAEAGRRFLEMMRLSDESERKAWEARQARQLRDAADWSRREALADERAQVLAQELSWQEAASLEGALLQLLQVHQEAVSLAEFEVTSAEALEVGRRLVRLAYSIGGVLAREAGMDPEEMSGGYCLPQRLNPFRCLDAQPSGGSVS